MLQGALAGTLAPGAQSYLDLFHEDAVFEFPFSPGGAVLVEGKEKMTAFLQSIEGNTVFDEFTLKANYSMDDGQTTVLEYEARGRDLKSGNPYVQSYIGVVQLREGRLTLLREYLNPLAVLKASGKTEDEIAR